MGGESLLQPVILCGGVGSRLWPLSRELFPKQLLSLLNEFSLLQNTILRLDGLGISAPFLVCNEKHRFLIAEQLREVDFSHSHVLLEPVGRNTAPAVAVAALQAMGGGVDPILLVLPADHVIHDVSAFHLAVSKAVALAVTGMLVTFGIVPTAPETGYGYILRGEALGEGGYRVGRFVEKPSHEQAELYLANGDYFWNSGMFVFRASRYISELERYAPEMLAACREAVSEARHDLSFLRLDPDAFRRSPDDSIDYAIMEKTLHAAVVPLSAGWSDIGSFDALSECSPQDHAGNTALGDVILEGSSNCYVNASGRLVALIGVENLVVVETPDAILVVARDAVQDVKKIVGTLKAQGRDELLTHRRVYRPWGYYEGIDKGRRYQVKRIGVNPAASLSLQMHYHRAEHWIVVSGTAEVTYDDKTFLLSENESTYIALGQKHRLRNPGKTMLEMIEVQSGSYLGEDDIVRFKDTYGRS